MNYQRLAPILIPLILWLFNQIFNSYPQLFYYSLLVGLLLIVIGIKLESRLNKNTIWPLFIISPALVFLSFSFFSSLISNIFWIQTLFILSAWFNFAYFRNLYYYWRYDAPERKEKLDSLLISGGFLTIFASAASLYSLPTFLSLPLFLLLGVLGIIIFLMFWQFLPVKKISLKSAWPLMIVNTLTLLELAWALTMLPFNFRVLGFLAAIFYYFLLSIWRLAGRQALNRQTLRWPIIFSLIIIIILFLTSSWL